jgi:hypothetical protein
MTDRFDLEQEIMHCWSVCDDIKALRETISNKLVTQDFQENYLLGLETIYQVKFEKLWDAFEQCVANKQI